VKVWKPLLHTEQSWKKHFDVRRHRFFNAMGNPERSFSLYKAAFLAGLLLLGDWLPAAYGQGDEIVVGAAISLKETFSELGGIYQRTTGTKITFSFGASGELERQIEAGAPIDVFASAAEMEMDKLQEKNLIDRATRFDFVRNSLVLLVPADSKLQMQSFSDLEKPSVAKIAIGNPRTVPAGQYAHQLLWNLRLWSKVESRLILAENVRQVLDYVARAEVDAGIVYATDVPIAHGAVLVAARALNKDYGPILYPVAVIRNSASARAAKAFVNLVLSPEGIQIFKKSGFQSVN
jgi:molybdate transport system substrate-binding protein